jgi:hypothetical protein
MKTLTQAFESGWNLNQAETRKTPIDEIREYFTRKNFLYMFVEPEHIPEKSELDAMAEAIIEWRDGPDDI